MTTQKARVNWGNTSVLTQMVKRNLEIRLGFLDFDGSSAIWSDVQKLWICNERVGKGGEFSKEVKLYCPFLITFLVYSQYIQGTLSVLCL